MKSRLKEIVDIISRTHNVVIEKPFDYDSNFSITGEIKVLADQEYLFFQVVILPPYPQQFHDMETIKFYNKNLIEYDHVTQEGSICIHTLHSPILEQKLVSDLNSLKEWISKYYLKDETDEHYEHISVVPISINEINSCFLFTEVNHQFKNGEFGFFRFAAISNGSYYQEQVVTYVVQDFVVNKERINCKWSTQYLNLESSQGIFYFSQAAPVKNKRFAVTNWIEMKEFMSQDFLQFLYSVKKTMPTNSKKLKNSFVPLLFGYKINDEEIHWQAIAIETNSFPNYAEKIGPKTYLGRFHDQLINWTISNNCSYKYFFGRGSFGREISEKKILIIGVGAIGSIVATTLTRGGCMDITLCDYDIKEPENVCRGEFAFSTGISNKVDDLSRTLTSISPFIEIKTSTALFDYGQFLSITSNWIDRMESVLEEYDLIFDCSANNDVASMIDKLDIKAKIFNLSITNHASNLVCVVKPNIYAWTMQIFEKIDSGSNQTLYNPTGCWSPTFSASYNDIACLIQYALKHINLKIQNGNVLRSFYLSTTIENGFEIKLNQF